MKYLVTGSNGQLGRAFQKILPKNSAIFTDVEDLDVTDENAILDFVKEKKPQAVLHCAAYTNVDGCEENQGLADAVNHKSVEYLAKACNEINAILVYISTDYVFDGTKTEPYNEGDQPNPQSIYGKTKLEGEEAAKRAKKHYIFRTSWLYGDGKNFVKTMLELAQNLGEIKVVADQVGRPTFAEDLAKGILEALDKNLSYGIYNYQNSGNPVSWANFAREIFKITGKDVKVIDISTGEYLKLNEGKKIAARPHYSVLNTDLLKEKGIKIPAWNGALQNFLKA